MILEARLMRDDRILTDKIINWIVPLIFVGLLALFIPYILVVVPIEESGICWFFYFTKSTYELQISRDSLHSIYVTQ